MLTKEQLEDAENVKRRVQPRNMADGKSIKKRVKVLFRIIPPLCWLFPECPSYISPLIYIFTCS